MSRVHLPEYRKDPVTGRWVIIAERRSSRPNSIVHEPNGHVIASPEDAYGPVEGCPFCPGAEQETPKEIDALRDDGSAADAPGWRVRVFGNKYPAVEEALELELRPDPLFEAMTGYGWHEVVVLSPDHHRHIDQLGPAQVLDVLRVLRQRVTTLMEQPGVLHVLPFKNKGRIAGASIDHPHFQIIGTPLLPRLVEDELVGAARYRGEHGGCIFCAIGAAELAAGERVVAYNEHFLALCPWAARFPFELLLLPRRHCHDLRGATDVEFGALAELLVEVFGRLNRVAGTPPFNLVLHTAPADTLAEEYHWHVEIMPKLTTPAGFEWGTSAHINPLSPERAASLLIRAGLPAATEDAELFAAEGGHACGGQPGGAAAHELHGEPHALPSGHEAAGPE